MLDIGTDESGAKMGNTGPELKSYLYQMKKDNRLLNPEYLKFDSTIESGNLERVDAFQVNNRIVEM